MSSLSKKCGLIIMAVILVVVMASLAYAQATSKIYPDGLYADNDGHDDCTSSAGTGYNGWDIDEVELSYDSGTDILHVRISMWNGVIAGDIDNNGNPGTAEICFTGDGWTDDPNLGGPAGFGEAIDFIIDLDLDNTYDYIAGVSNSTYIGDPSGGFAVVNYDTSDPVFCPPTPVLPPGTCYGTTAWAGGGSVTNNPGVTDPTNPDFEFDINQFSVMLGETVRLDPKPNFSFVVRTGKLEDGTGEDYFQLPGEPTVVTLSSLTARSSAGGSVSGLWLGLVGLTVLAAGGSLWIRRQSGQGKIV
jgi:hypothetical protein